MARRRLTAIAGALGLVGWLVTSGVTAQAATTPGPDLTYSYLLATYLWSGQSVCFSNGTYLPTNPCTIVQPPAGQAPNGRNIAVCVQISSAAVATQPCSISQTNDTRNNYALVIQLVRQSGGSSQTANQTASIQQTTTTTGSGSNFAGVFETVLQSIGAQDDPMQTNSQHVEVAPSTGPGLKQLSGTGSNFAAVSQFSAQSASGGLAQTQIADQFAGHSARLPGDGIDQTGAANAAVLSHIQKQQLGSTVSQTSQNQTATQDGDITQNGAPGQNLAVGSQRQDQQEQGPSDAVQTQLGDPKCCSMQNGGQFFVTINTNQLASDIAPNQREVIFGNCDSPGGTCHMALSATQQGVTTTGTPPCLTPSSCHQTIFLGGGT